MFDLVGGTCGQRAGTRVAVIGSCRVHDPFETLANTGRAVRVWANPSSATHSFGEARQIVRYTRGEIDIPESLRPFIFHPPEPPARSATEKCVLETVDAVFLEVSELRQISHGQYFFQANFFYREFVSKYGAPLLPWYRAFSLDQPIGDDLIAEALGKLADRTAEERAIIESVLRHTKLRIPDVEAAAAMLDDIVFDRSKQWVLASHFLVPGLTGTQMNDRARLIDVVRQAAGRHGVAMFDPTMILEQHGREVALASGGKDIYHFNADIHETVANALLDAGGLIDTKASSAAKAAGGETRAVSVTAAAELVNDALIQLHQERVSKLGVDGSGLYSHYKGLMDSHQISGSKTADLVNLIANLLPRFDRYDVLRAGLGEITFVLAALGLRAAGFDNNPRRFSAMSAGLEKLADADPELARRITIGRAIIPDVPERGKTLAVAHHLIGFTPAQEGQALAQLAAYDALLIDPRIFLFSRATDQEREAVVETLKRLGFSQIRQYPRLGVVYCAKLGLTKVEVLAEVKSHTAADAALPLAVVATETSSAPAAPSATEPHTWALSGPFQSDGGFAWVCVLNDKLHELTDVGSAPYRSHLRLLENGEELAPGHARHDTIRTQGGGHYSFWGGRLYFSASDGTDPNTNGHVYSALFVN